MKRKNLLFSLLLVMLTSCISLPGRINYESGADKNNAAGILLDEKIKYIVIMDIDDKNINPISGVRNLVIFKPGKRTINFVYGDGKVLARPILVSYNFEAGQMYGVKYDIVGAVPDDETAGRYVRMVDKNNLLGIGEKSYIKITILKSTETTLGRAIEEYSKEPEKK